MSELLTGIAGNTRSAQEQAVQERTKKKSEWHKHWGFHAIIGAGVVTIVLILLSNVEWSFFWKLLTGGLLYYSMTKLAEQKVEALQFWPTLLRWSGVAIVAITLLSSSFVYYVGQIVNYTEQAVAGNPNATPPAILDFGKTHEVDLRAQGEGQRTVAGVGPNDTIVVHLGSAQTASKACRAEFEPTQKWIEIYGDRRWYDPMTFVVQTSGQRMSTKSFELSETTKKGLLAEGLKLDVVVYKVCKK